MVRVAGVWCALVAATVAAAVVREHATVAGAVVREHASAAVAVPGSELAAGTESRTEAVTRTESGTKGRPEAPASAPAEAVTR